MKKVHFVEITVFDKENLDLRSEIAELTDNTSELKNLKIEIMPATEGFDHELTVAKLRLEKTADTFISKLLTKITISDDKVDDKAVLNVRLDKKAFIEDKLYILTESGDCIHIKANLAAYPAKKSKGLEILKNYERN